MDDSGLGGSRSGAAAPDKGGPAGPHHRRRLSSFAALATSNTSKVSLLGFLAIVCVFPFLFSSVSQQQHALEQFGAPGFRYESLAAAEKGKRQQQNLRARSKSEAAAATDGGGEDFGLPDSEESMEPPQQEQGQQPQYEPQAVSAKPAAAAAAAPAVAAKPEQPPPAAVKQKEGPVVIYMDWVLPSERFGLLNYRALESVLTHYPDAKVRLLLAAPERANYYKYGNALPATQFEKYRKRGYDVGLQLVGDKGLTAVNEGQPGAAYFKREFWGPREKTVFNEHLFLRTENAIQDAKTNHFVRLLQLWETGGLYLDSFSTLLTQPFPAGQRFWSFGRKCVADRDAGANAEWAHTGSQEHYVLAAPTAKDPVLGCVLRRFDDPKAALHACMAAADGGDGAGAACVRKALDECAATVKGGAPTLEKDPVLWLGCEGSGAKKSLLYLDNEDWKDVKLVASLGGKEKGQAAASAVWMGPEASKGLWKVYNPLVQELLTRSVRLDRWHPLQADPRCRRTCDRYSAAQSVQRAHEHNATLTEGELQAAEYVCAPSIIIPGAFKSATSSLFTAVAKHPQVLRPLMGANFKETGVYMPVVGRNRVRDRLHAFPFIEPNEPFVTADATVYYLSSEVSPRTLQADSPNAQVLVSLRDPLSRCFSQYRYAFNNATESFRSAVEEAVPIMRECYRRHLEGVDLKALLQHKGKGAKLAKDISYCTSPMLRTPSRRAILSSLYLPQLLTWVDTFGRARVHVVTKEAMEHAPDTVMNEVYDFLALCRPTSGEGAANAMALTKENVRDGLVVPEGFGLEEADMLELSEAFQPWNEALYAFLKSDLGWPTSEESFIKAKLQFHRAVLFTAATPCEHCDAAERLLGSPSYRLKAEEVEVVRLNGAHMKVMEYVDKLAGSPPNKSPPYVFIDGLYVGGWPELQRRHEAKQLAPLLARKGGS